MFVCLQHNSKTKDPKVFKLGTGMTLGYPTSGMVLLAVKRLKDKVMVRVGLTAIGRGF